jgi:hypothetical protein
MKYVTKDVKSVKQIIKADMNLCLKPSIVLYA